MRRVRPWWIPLVVCAALAAPVQAGPAKQAAALDAVPDEEAPEIERDALDLQARLRERPTDRDSVDTALVFTNPGGDVAWVKCAGFDDRGRFVGAARTRVPIRGLRYLRASDVAGGRDFVGHVLCRSRGAVIGSAVLVGAGLTDLDVQQRGAARRTLLRFPLVASY